MKKKELKRLKWVIKHGQMWMCLNGTKLEVLFSSVPDDDEDLSVVAPPYFEMKLEDLLAHPEDWGGVSDYDISMAKELGTLLTTAYNLWKEKWEVKDT